MKGLHISTDLTLPLDTVTSTLIVYGGKGMGKTVFGNVLAEELFANKQRFAVIDPMGVWWGLRHSADGRGPGIEILILGGKYGDMPIEPTGGAVIADLVADESISVVIDISRRPDGKMWARADRIRFVADYCTRLYERQGERRRPLMQIIDEAGRYVPEVIRKEEPDVARCMGAIASLVEEARNVGVGVALITQRSARMNKAVSELADAMFAFRTVGPRSVDAILDWFGEHVPKERWKELIGQLRALPRGTALVVSPGWLEFEGKAAMRMRTTFDSSATPKAGKTQHASGSGAVPDLTRYAARMAETIERVKADDPRELRRQIAELKKQIAKPPAAVTPTPMTKAATPSKEDLDKATLRGSMQMANQMAREFKAIIGPVRRGLLQGIATLRRAVNELEAAVPPETIEFKATVNLPTAAASVPPTVRPAPPVARQHAPPAVPNESGNGNLGTPERKLLTALAQYPAGLRKERLAVLAGYQLNGNFYNVLGSLRSRGAVTPKGVEPIAITDEGLETLGPFEPLPTGNALREYWLRRLSGPESKVLKVLFDAYPAEMSKEDLAAQSAYQLNGNFYNILGALRGRGLMTPKGTSPRAAHEMFEE